MDQTEGKKLLYLEPFSGISGDMFLGSIFDLGLDKEYLRGTIQDVLPVDTSVQVWEETRGGVSGTRFGLDLPETDRERNLGDIFDLLHTSNVSTEIVNKSKEMFDHLARVEAEIHGKRKEEIHFHELGGLDSIADVVGAAAAVHSLQPQRVFSASVNVGSGTVVTDHGELPVPAPATAELLRESEAPTYTGSVSGELTTPTGALILATFVDEFVRPSMIPEEIGYGLGSRNTEGRGNFLRTTVARPAKTTTGQEGKGEGCELIMETNIDDMNPEFYPVVEEKLLDAGAHDVFDSPVNMKKNRPGVKLTVICNEKDRAKLSEIIFRETTTLGIRIQEISRKKLDREFTTVETDLGKVEVKVGYLNGEPVTCSPEFESCRDLAEEKGLPVKKVYQDAVSRAKDELGI